MGARGGEGGCGGEGGVGGGVRGGVGGGDGGGVGGKWCWVLGVELNEELHNPGHFFVVFLKSFKALLEATDSQGMDPELMLYMYDT